ncbi:hypothetical protein B0H13DRAFT_2558459 [Mycena leptocephala]|nr:hypothetical protein B0H13DRAFT_2558459 [Mycena leptocephala]
MSKSVAEFEKCPKEEIFVRAFGSDISSTGLGNWRPSRHVSLHPRFPSHTRDLTFLRFLFANDTSKVDHKRLCLRLSSRWKHPKDSILQTVDYTHRNPKRYIGPLEKERARDKRGMSVGTSTVARATRRGGRMELHLMRVWDGHRTRRWMFPRHSHCFTLRNGLIRILNDIHPDDVCEVENLLKENEDGVQIHS